MSISVFYIVTDAQGNLIDWSDRIAGLSVLGQEARVLGSGGDDSVYVQAGSSANLTELGSGNDRIYLTGHLGDYSQSLDDAGIYTFTRTLGLAAGQTEVVRLSYSGEDDRIFFADGHVLLNEATVADANGLPALLTASMLQSGGTPAGGPNGSDGSDGIGQSTTHAAPLRVIVQKATGIDLPQAAQVGQHLVIQGSGGDDSVYVRTGSSVDASGLGSGNDRVYLTGQLSDYSQSIDAAGIYTLTRTTGLPSGVSEVVRIAFADEADEIYFADGHIVLDSSTPGLFDAVAGLAQPLTTAMFVQGGEGTPGLAANTIAFTTSLSMAENNTLAGTLTATDGTPANQLLWSLSGSAADNAKFTLDSHGVLRFKAAPDYETPASSASPASNTYSVQVAVVDQGGHTSTGNVSVAVSDVVLEPTLTSVADGTGHSAYGHMGDSVSATITFSEAISVTGTLSASTFLPTLMADGHALTLTGVSQGVGTAANVFTVTATLPAGNDTQVTLTGLTVNGITLTGVSSHAEFAGQASLQPAQTASYTLDNTAPNVGTAAPVLTLASNGAAVTTHDIKVGDQIVLSIPIESTSGLKHLPEVLAQPLYHADAASPTGWDPANLYINLYLANLYWGSSATYTVGGQTISHNVLAVSELNEAQKSAFLSVAQVRGGSSTVIKVGGIGKEAVWSYDGSNLYLTHTVQASENGAITVDTAALQTALTSFPVDTTGVLAGITDLAGNPLTIGGTSSGTFAAIASPTVQVDGIAPTIGNTPASSATLTHALSLNLDNLSFSDTGGSAASPMLQLSIVATNGTVGGLTDADPNTAGIQLVGAASALATAFAPATFTPGNAGLTASLDLTLTDPAGNQTVYHYPFASSGVIL